MSLGIALRVLASAAILIAAYLILRKGRWRPRPRDTIEDWDDDQW